METTKKVTWETPDRADLVAQANYFAQLMYLKQSAHLRAESNLYGPLELTQQEQTTYNSALNFLAREFARGVSKRKVTAKELTVKLDPSTTPETEPEGKPDAEEILGPVAGKPNP